MPVRRRAADVSESGLDTGTVAERQSRSPIDLFRREGAINDNDGDAKVIIDTPQALVIQGTRVSRRAAAALAARAGEFHTPRTPQRPISDEPSGRSQIGACKTEDDVERTLNKLLKNYKGAARSTKRKWLAAAHERIEEISHPTVPTIPFLPTKPPESVRAHRERVKAAQANRKARD